MKLSVSPPPYEGAPVVVFISGLGGSGSYWLPQLAALEPEYQVVCYDQLGTGNNPATLPEDYSLAQMADELARALADAGIERYSVVGHALGALVGLQLALDGPDVLAALVCVNGWLTLNAHTRRCFQVRERLLHYGGAQAWVERAAAVSLSGGLDGRPRPRLEAEEALALAHFQGKTNLLHRLSALKKPTSAAMRRAFAARYRSSAPPTTCWCPRFARLNCRRRSRTATAR
ncbi:alpha/beta fold hydrolase [Enterobacter asburiae]|uniref:alpha/beta fold hydrolase n=1 Tax=Enterobacter asburiae TaxID=61645 RepID=UPI00388D6108